MCVCVCVCVCVCGRMIEWYFCGRGKKEFLGDFFVL